MASNSLFSDARLQNEAAIWIGSVDFGRRTERTVIIRFRLSRGSKGQEILEVVIVLPLCSAELKLFPLDVDGDQVILAIGFRGRIFLAQSFEVRLVKGADAGDPGWSCTGLRFREQVLNKTLEQEYLVGDQ